MSSKYYENKAPATVDGPFPCGSMECDKEAEFVLLIGATAEKIPYCEAHGNWAAHVYGTLGGAVFRMELDPLLWIQKRVGTDRRKRDRRRA